MVVLANDCFLYGKLGERKRKDNDISHSRLNSLRKKKKNEGKIVKYHLSLVGKNKSLVER